MNPLTTAEEPNTRQNVGAAADAVVQVASAAADAVGSGLVEASLNFVGEVIVGLLGAVFGS